MLRHPRLQRKYVVEGHIAAQAGVLGLPDHTHPTAAELLCDLVVGDGLAEHGVGTRR